tara:strand:- start:1314 stop:2126 length:813 start_codon:yes stop_codon:yes gene_type:complete
MIIDDIRSLNLPNTNTWIYEAEFGYDQINQYCSEIKNQGSVLEIGCGSGILLSILSEKFQDLNFEGIEPFGDGFNKLKTLNEIIKSKGIEIKNTSYEEFVTKKKYNLIFCINVFEHITDWRHFLLRVEKFLKRNGKIIILCPNYGFPYESHFSIPILINKKITYFLFKKYINDFEFNNDCIGLWKSLNLVKKKEVYQFYKYSQLFKKFAIKDDLSIIDFMFRRLLTNKTFRKRHIKITSLVIFLEKYRFFKLLKNFPNLIPYMKLTFHKY